jgi:hypothetical protein
MAYFDECIRHPVLIQDHLYCLSHTGLDHFVFTDITSEEYFRPGEYFESESGDIAINGNYAAVTFGDGVVIADVSDPAYAPRVGFYDHSHSTVHSIATSGDYLYVGGCFGGLVIVDISDPAHPSEVSVVQLHGGTVALSNGYAYVDRRVVDVRDPANPMTVALTDDHVCAVSGDFAYVAEGDLKILDVTDPVALVLVGFYDPEWLWGTNDAALTLAVSGDLVYVLDRFDGVYIVRNDLVAVGLVEPAGIPNEFFLYPNYPNPFNPTTTISYGLPRLSEATLTVYDVLGREIRVLAFGTQPAGTHEVTFDAAGLPSGVYLYRLQTGDYVETRRMVVVR